MAAAASDDEDAHADLCSVCDEGGDLVCCDHCSCAFHNDCLAVPPDEDEPKPGSVSHTIAAYQDRADAHLRHFTDFLEVGLDTKLRRVWDLLFDMFEREADAINQHIAG